MDIEGANQKMFGPNFLLGGVNMTSNKDLRSAFTLIETMVVILISALCLAGIGSIFASNRKAFQITTQLQNLEEQARVALKFLRSDISGSIRSQIGRIDNLSATAPWFAATSLANPTPTVAGSDAIRLFVPMIDIQSFDLSPTTRNDCSPSFSPGRNYSLGLPVGILRALPGYTVDRNMITRHQAALFSKGEPQINCMALITRRTADRRFKTCPQKFSTLELQFAFQSWRSNCAAVLSASPDTQVSLGRSMIYYLRERDPAIDASKPNNAQLVRYYNGNVEVVASNMVDMQLEYGLDTTGDGVIDRWSDGAISSSSDHDSFFVDSDQIVATRVKLLLASSIPNPFGQGGAAIDPNALSEFDAYDPILDSKKMLKIYTATFRARNR